MKIPSADSYAFSSSLRELSMGQLEVAVNAELERVLRDSKEYGRDYLARHVISEAERIIDLLNRAGYGLGRVEYSGDVDFENSEQLFGNGDVMGTGLMIQFRGFKCKVYWAHCLT
jgi:hypothetical protein